MSRVNDSSPLLPLMPVLKSDVALQRLLSEVFGALREAEQRQLETTAIAALVRPELVSAAQRSLGRVSMLDDIINHIGADNVSG